MNLLTSFVIAASLLQSIHTSEAVKDTQPPRFTTCPKDIVIESTEPFIRVNWIRPIAVDVDSHLPPLITSNYLPGSKFAVPGIYEIQYIAKDHDGNQSPCRFRVTLKRKPCPMFPAPKNGALRCVTVQGSRICAPACNNKYDFVFNPPLIYYCVGGAWNSFSLRGTVPNAPWPDCAVRSQPSWQKTVGLPSYFFDGDANDPKVQSYLKTSFIQLLKLPFVPPPFCLHQPHCTADNVSLYI